MQKNMEYVYAVYQEHSFSKAAEKLFVSQPALSATIKKLEEELRLSLFNRSSTPISLTPAGECYIRAVEKIADAEAALNEQLSQLTNENRGGISIGGAAFFCAHVLPSIIQEFCRLHPGCTVNLVEGNAADLSKCLQSGVLDLIIDVEQLDANVFESLVWQAEDIILGVPAYYEVNEKLTEFRLNFEDIRSGKYLDKTTPMVSMKHFENVPFVFLKKGNDMYRRGLKICKNAGFVPTVTMYLDQLLTSYYVARDGKGAVFLRAGITRYAEPSCKMYFYKIDDKNASRNIMLYWKRSSKLSLAAEELIRFLTVS